ncbi:hypothetical protein [Aureimonas pseudogalii]|uniref:Uncharacterized protein n=1 Tax=Aureimonas pseudogalii TaxID=1744844 RepID=A0A7W6E8A6_9HYPH|nr:hypothetical protein [Aureimonas pseudogalii]MBB3996580.1 hypothetical protein [Aureimonas pseudogalii]
MAAASGERSAPLSAHLLRALTREVRALEIASKAAHAASTEAVSPKGDGEIQVGAKARIEAITQLTRTLEKLLELKQLEALQRAGAAEADAAETERLSAEMLKRLRALEERRVAGGGLFAVADASGAEA